MRTGRIAELFYRSAAFLLLLTAAAKLYSATGNARMLSMSDAFLPVNNRLLMVAVAAAEVVVAACLLRRSQALMPARALFWLSGNFALYRIGISAMGIKYCPCLGTLGQKLPVTQAHLNMILTGAGALLVFWQRIHSLARLGRKAETTNCGPRGRARGACFLNGHSSKHRNLRVLAMGAFFQCERRGVVQVLQRREL
jgi:hypothetical protein